MQRFVVTPRASATARITRCSWFDGILRYIAPRLAWYFPARLDAARLRETLADVLCDFGEWSGRAAPDGKGLYIQHGVGATFEHTARAETNAQLLAAGERRSELICPASSLMGALRGRQPLFAVRLTDTADGCVLGVSFHHILGDIHSLMLLMRAWERAYTGAPYTPPLAAPDRNAYMDEHMTTGTADADLLRLLDVPELLRLGWLVNTQSQRIDLCFSRDELAALHRSVGAGHAITAHDALCAHVFACVRSHSSAPARSRMAVSVNLRKRFGLSENLVGNYIDFAYAEGRSDSTPLAIASELRASIGSITERPLLQHELQRIGCSDASSFTLQRCMPACFDPVQSTLFVSSWANFGLCDLHFGVGPAELLLCAPLEKTVWTGLIVERPRGQGMLVRLWLPKALAEHVASAARTRLAA